MTRVIRACAHAWMHLIGTHMHVWTCLIAVQVMMEVVGQAHKLAVHRATRSVLYSFHFGCANVYQGERDICDCRK